jgi:hypothetical protein
LSETPWFQRMLCSVHVSGPIARSLTSTRRIQSFLQPQFVH